ncbi:MAG: hypothetical protein ACI38Q_04915 [Candidatus Bruticola sp.]
MRLTFGFTQKICVCLAAAVCLSAAPVQADEVYVRNKPFKQVVYVESSLYAPLYSLVKAMRSGISVNNDGRLIFVPEADSLSASEFESALTVRGWLSASQSEGVFESEYDQTVFPVPYIKRGGEIWVPVRLISERLGFTIKNYPATGIIDIVAPRPISNQDRLAAEELKAEKAAQVKRAEKVLAVRRAEKIKRRQQEAEEAKKAALNKKKAAKNKTNDSAGVKRRRVSYSAEGDFPSEFDDDAALLHVTAPGKATHTGGAAVQTKPVEEGSTYPKAKPKAVKKNEPSNKKTAAEVKPKVETQEEAAQVSSSPVVQAVPFVAYTMPKVSANYGDGTMNYSVTIVNRSKAEAKNISVVLCVTDGSDRKLITKNENIGNLQPGEEKVLTGQGRHPLRGSMPRTSYHLDVDLNWGGRQN